ncbi:MAG: mechanosensitive ion channel [Candidatus Obscuribacterales bacterium]|nr:mechanosensitive ion channel [Candidatus Obscuribacterales bacterium]
MDLTALAPKITHFLVASRYSVPFWVAVVVFLLFTYRKASVTFLWRNLHLIEDLVLEKEFLSQIDLPLKLLLITFAITPFSVFLPPPYSVVLFRATGFILPLLLLHVFMKGFDLIVFSWYFDEHRGTKFPLVFRVSVLSFIYIIFILVLLEYCFGLNVLPLIATSTVATAVLGLALQDTLKNLFAGLTISLEKRFYYGDWVAFRLDPSLTTIGEISEIGWRTTRIRTLDDSYAVIPNVMFTSNHVVNFSRPTPCYARTLEFPLSLNASPALVCKILLQSLQGIEGISDEPPPEALPLSVKSDSVVYRLRFWIKDFVSGDRIAGSVISAVLADFKAADLLPAPSSAVVASVEPAALPPAVVQPNAHAPNLNDLSGL